jgi:hypothetical protein
VLASFRHAGEGGVVARQWNILPGEDPRPVDTDDAILSEDFGEPILPTPIGPIIAASLDPRSDPEISDLLQRLETRDTATGKRTAVRFQLGRRATHQDLEAARRLAAQWNRAVVVDEHPLEAESTGEVAGAGA